MAKCKHEAWEISVDGRSRKCADCREYLPPLPVTDRATCPGCGKPVATEAERTLSRTLPKTTFALCWDGSCSPPGGWPERVRELEAEMAALLDTFRHYHRAGKKRLDACDLCGLDIRNAVHAMDCAEEGPAGRRLRLNT